MVVNELMQWAVIAVLAFIMIGLLRQLGMFMGNSSGDYGPRVGRPLPRTALPANARETLREQIAGLTGIRAGGVLVVSENCEPCHRVIDELKEQSDNPGGFPLLVVSTGSTSDEFVVSLERLTSLIVRDEPGRILKRLTLPGTPYLMMLDDELIVRQNVVGERLVDHAIEWTFPPDAWPARVKEYAVRNGALPIEV